MSAGRRGCGGPCAGNWTRDGCGAAGFAAPGARCGDAVAIRDRLAAAGWILSHLVRAADIDFAVHDKQPRFDYRLALPHPVGDDSEVERYEAGENDNRHDFTLIPKGTRSP